MGVQGNGAISSRADRSNRVNGCGEPRTRAVVLAGGRGTRLAPYTSIVPKPLMPIGDRSILELVIGRLASCGIKDVTLCVGYLSHLIQAVIAHAVPREVTIRYVHEEQALGTAGPLRLVEGIDETFIAMNGDILTTLDHGELLRQHREAGGILTIATRQRPIKIDYGVLHLGTNGDRSRVCEYVEKPEMTVTVSMGIYVLEPEALEYIPPAVHFDLPDLVHALLRAHEPVHTYHYDGLWFDIGRRDDYEQAAAAWAENPVVGDGGPDAPSRDAALPVTAAVTNGSGGS